MHDRTRAVKLVVETLRSELRLEAFDLTESDELDLLPGADSVRLMRVVAELEERLGVQFDDDRINTANTVGEVVDLVVEAQLVA
jgi:acyl carrier protein